MDHSQHKGYAGGIRKRMYPESKPALLPDKKFDDGTGTESVLPHGMEIMIGKGKYWGSVEEYERDSGQRLPRRFADPDKGTTSFSGESHSGLSADDAGDTPFLQPLAHRAHRRARRLA